MEYHADRFTDASLILYKEGQPIALFPAEQEGDTVYSHRGLTYAGWILSKGLTAEIVEALIKETLVHYREENIAQLDIRMIPEFFASESQAHLYAALNHSGAKRKATVTHHCTPLPYTVTDRGKRWGKRRAKSRGLQLSPSSAIQTFWEEILIPNLRERHGVSPTHSLAEMEYLQQRFPQAICFFAVMRQGEMLGGALVFVSATTAHLQYIAASPRGRSLRCLDLLVSWLIEEAFPDKAYFNMGVSHIPATGGINHGLVQWKESFGGRPVEVSTYCLPTQPMETG